MKKTTLLNFHASLKFYLNRLSNNRVMSVLKDVAQAKFSLMNLFIDWCPPRP